MQPFYILDNPLFWIYNADMLKVKYEIDGECQEISAKNLTEAMDIAKNLNCYVTIAGDGMEFCGMFGARIIENGLLPDGTNYEWKKRRI